LRRGAGQTEAHPGPKAPPAAEADRDLVVRLREGIKKRGNVPRHVAVIMDGNGRWAQNRGLPRIAGHQAGRASVRHVVEGCVDVGIPILTLYTFSIENWQRPADEVEGLMEFLCQVLVEERGELLENGVRLQTIGRLEDLPASVRDELEATRTYLGEGKNLCLNLALSYGGRAEIVDTVRRIAAAILRGEIRPEEIDEDLVEENLYTRGQPHPDLLIRTSGEMRLSNFLLWQLAYAEIWVTETLWPDFSKVDLFQAVADYQKRNRRFGRVG
jgi:undecaprenyl diphosphate synthase